MKESQQKMLDVIIAHPELRWEFSEKQPDKVVGEQSETCTFATLEEMRYVTVRHFDQDGHANIEYFSANDKTPGYNPDLRSAILKACGLQEI